MIFKQRAPVLLLLPILVVAAVPSLLLGQEQSLELTLQRAVELALAEDRNARIQLVEATLQETQARSRQARAPLLPHLGAGVVQQRQTRNLEAIGLRAIDSFRPPALVGPFGTFDARGSLTQSLLDIPRIRSFQASKVAVEAAGYDKDRARNETAAEVARAYLFSLRARERLAAAKANTELARSLRRLAENQMEAGTGTRIEVIRADVQLSNELQQELEAENEYRDSLLVLLRQIGLPLDRQIHPSDRLQYQQKDLPSLEETLSTAFSSRDDLQSRLKRLEEAEMKYQASRLERLPKLAGFLDYGTIGTTAAEAIPTWTVGLSVRVPIYDGGAIEADQAVQAARLRKERVRVDDLRAQIELEVRQALDALEVARSEVDVSHDGEVLAREELERAQRRYRAGVTTSLEVTEAQTRLQRATDNRIRALYRHGLARIELAHSTGTVQSFVLTP